MSSSISVRSTTAPGVAAMFRPTSKPELSTIAGTRGALAMSRSRFRAPRSRLRPAVSITAFADAGFSSGTLLGASACWTFSHQEPHPLLILAPVQLGVRDQLIRGPSGGQVGLHQPAQQRVLRPGGVGESPVPPVRCDAGSAGRRSGPVHRPGR